MSNTYTIQCTDCVEYYDVGQTSNGVPYVYNDFEFLQFLISHRRHNLVFTDEWGNVMPEAPISSLEKQLRTTLDLIHTVFNFKKDYFVSHGEVFSVREGGKVQFIRKATFTDETVDSIVSRLFQYIEETK